MGRDRLRVRGAMTGVLAALLGGCALPRAVPEFDLALAGAHIPVELVESWLKAARDVRFHTRRVQFYFSQHGFQNLRSGDCDLACTDRPVTLRELREFADVRIEGFRVAFYGYALYVHPDNPLDSIFAKHVGLVFEKKVTDWKELGGREGPIRVIGPRKSTRGGEVLMRETRIIFSPAAWEVMDTNAEIVDAVAADPSALGFAAVGFDRNTRCLGLRMERNGPPAFPSLEEIEGEQYGLAKVIYVYARVPLSPAAAAAVEYLYAPEGQRAMGSTDVWPIPRERSAVEPTP